ncbi:MAG: 1-phosphofructokinase family hexose kinase [Acetobacteraceae bacterium]|nr:1-phosphofructokinase family hexose kinase [Pseudomonadota bacterium]
MRIATLTLNPAIDVHSTAPAVRPTHKIRTTDEHLDPGGGGINVSRVLHALGANTLALILVGGATGVMMEEMLTATGVPWQALPIRGQTRISLNVLDRQSGQEYRFVPEGPLVEPQEWEAALRAIEQVEAEWIVASGSLPRGVPADFYARCAEIARRRGQKFGLDTSGAALRAAATSGVELLKLSLGELESLADRPLPDNALQEREVNLLLRAGAARVIAVSLGGDGAILATAAGLTRLPALPVRHRGAVGAGDSFMAGLVYGLSRGWPERNCLGYALAAGACAVSTYGTARVRREEVEAQFDAWRREQAAVR